MWWKIGLTLYLLGGCLAEDILVSTDGGTVKGFTMKSRSGREYSAFTKIPYALPPVGQLRFKEPVPGVKWEGVLEANEDLPDCNQIPVFDPVKRNQTFGTEDCLYLSVFTPQAKTGSNLPVLVYIHGGGWRSELPANGPATRSQFIMDQDVVFVMFHYRLGALGFLSTEDEALPGNLGLKDQVQVIKWLKRNVDSFGGDPHRITLFGNSAGGASTHYHLISPLSKDLVQGGISESGTGTCLWAFSVPGVARTRAMMLGEHLGCPTSTSQELVDCLRGKTALEITDAERIFMGGHASPTIVFQPVLEKGPGAFLPISPFNVQVEKPWLVGLTSEDGAVLTIEYALSEAVRQHFKEHKEAAIPQLVMFENTTDKADDIIRLIDQQYFSEGVNIDRLTKMWTDSLFYLGAVEGLSRAKDNGYLFLYEHRGKTSSLDLFAKDMGVQIPDLGVSHTDELRSLLNFEDDEPTAADVQVSKEVVKIWADFAKNGKPTLNSDWKPYSDGKTFLRISENERVESDLWSDRIQFWRDQPLRSRMESLGL